MSGQKSSSVNHLISFWNNPDGHSTTPEEEPLVSGSGSSTSPIPATASRQSSNARPRHASRSATSPVASGSTSNRNTLPSPAAGAPRFRGPQAIVNPSTPISPTSASSPRPLTAASAPLLARPPLLPLRSIAPAPTRLFGTQRHGADNNTLRSPVRPGLLGSQSSLSSSSSSQANLFQRNAAQQTGGPIRPNSRATSSPVLMRGPATTSSSSSSSSYPSSSTHQPVGPITSSAISLPPSTSASSVTSPFAGNIPRERPSSMKQAENVSVPPASGWRPSITRIKTRPVLAAGSGESSAPTTAAGEGRTSRSAPRVASASSSSTASSAISAGLIPLRTIPPAPMKRPPPDLAAVDQEQTGKKGDGFRNPGLCTGASQPPSTSSSNPGSNNHSNRGQHQQRESSEGIVKLAFVPAAVSKTEPERRQVQHAARNHPLNPPTEPIRQPLDALQPLVKPPAGSENGTGSDGKQLGARAALQNISMADQSGQQQLPNPPPSARNNRHNMAVLGGGVRSRPNSEPNMFANAGAPQVASEATSPSSYHQRRNKTSIDDGDMRLDWHTKASSNSRSSRNSAGTDIIYAVVKGAPKPSVPKLAGATGSGTVFVSSSSASRPMSMVSSEDESRLATLESRNNQQTPRDGHGSDSSTAGNVRERYSGRSRAVATAAHSVSHNNNNKSSSSLPSHPPPAPSASSSAALIELKRLSTQSASSVASSTTLASSGSSSHPLFDDRDDEASTTLLDHELAEEATPLNPPGIEPAPQKTSRPNKQRPDTDPQHKVSSPADSLNQERLQRAKSILKAQKKEGGQGEEDKGGAIRSLDGVETPMATIRTRMDPGTSTLDSNDPLFLPTAPLVAFPVLDAYLASLKQPNFSNIPEDLLNNDDVDGSSSSLSFLKSKDDDYKGKNAKSPPVPEKPKSTTATRTTTTDSAASNDSKASSKSSSNKKKSEKPDPRKGMFPPLDKVPIGVSLDELKANITKPAGFFDQELQNVLLASTADGIMSGESTNIGISWMRFEIVRDFLQYMGLYLSVSGNSYADQKWLYTSVHIIPAVTSLDLSRVLGYGGIFLALFGLVAAIAMYTFKIMTKTDPNDDIEGLEVSSWSLRSKAKRIETIAIVFLLTTIYLPLAKFALDALVWSDTMWPVKNPYKTTDHPTWEPLGPAGIYRAPDDFCYVTSMRIQDINLAYVIIPLAVAIIVVNTIYFPLAVRRLVVVNLPRVDKYTEQGDQRLDPDEEYKRLTNQDNCPYNFLYNGYRRECGTYKVSVMFTKLLAVVIVVIFSKDNCIFRNTNRMVIEAIRASLQILLTISLIVRHYLVQPYLYQSQNISEYCTRACSVATSVLGLLIVLRAGPVDLLGILLTSTYIVMCVIVVWFVVRQTQKFQIFLKQLQRRLDFSLEIYNPKLNYAKHIKRRVWQETWTTALLTAKAFKMPPEKVVAYSQSPHRPPYLLNFSGTVAERHVENLKIIRQIGLRNYTRACRFLTPAIIRKRTLILKEYVGPDMYYAPELMASNIKTYFGKAYVVPFPFSVVFVYDESSVVVTLVREKELDRYLQQNEDPEIQRRRDIRQQLRALDGKFVIRPFIESRGVSQRDREAQGHGTMEMSLVNAPISYKRGLFTIHRKKTSTWKGHNMNPGFSVTITYTDGEISDPQGSPQLFHETTIGHSIIGITRDFQMTPALAKLLRDNHELIRRGLPKVHKVMRAYKDHYRREAHHKDETLSYGFFLNIYDNPTLRQNELSPVLMATEENALLRFPDRELATTIQFLYERMAIVHSSVCHQWWYLFWDDLYRKNHEEIPQLVPKSFSPAFPTSICYRPMPRAQLEQFLEEHGCWQKQGRNGFMHVGVLNRIYAFLNRLVFEDMRLRRCHRQHHKHSKVTGGVPPGGGVQHQRWWYGPQGQGDDMCLEKYWEISTAERTRIKNLWMVAEAKVDRDGTIKKIYRTHGDESGDEDGNVVDGDGKNGTIRRRPSRRILGWFDSITPRRQLSHKVPQFKDEEESVGGSTIPTPPTSSSSGKDNKDDGKGNKDDSKTGTTKGGRRRSAIISLGYIIPQTLQQKASMFSELIIGGSKDVLGDSDEEDDLATPTDSTGHGSSYARYRPHNGRIQMGTIAEGREDEGDDEAGYDSDEDEGGRDHALELKQVRMPTAGGISSNSSGRPLQTVADTLRDDDDDNPNNPFRTPSDTGRVPRLVTPSSRHELVRTSSEQTIVGNPFMTEAELLQKRPGRSKETKNTSVDPDSEETRLLLSYDPPAQGTPSVEDAGEEGTMQQGAAAGDTENGKWTRVDVHMKKQQQASAEEDGGVVSDSMSIASMSSEDFW